MNYKFVLACLLGTTSVDAAWVSSKVGTMTIYSNAPASYDKVVIMLHGGGGAASEWKNVYDRGSFGDTSKIKYIAAEAPHTGGLWYKSFKKDGCGLNDDCGYDLPSIGVSGDAVKAVIDAEKTLKSWTNSDKIFLGGYSQGGQMATYVQIAKMTEKLGGVIVFNGYPLPPLTKMPDQTTAVAQAASTYYKSDMRWMVMYGATDGIFPGTATKALYHSIMMKLGAMDVMKICQIEDGVGHAYTANGLSNMVRFVNGEDTYVYVEDKKDGSTVLVSSMASLLVAAMAYVM